jgi:6-phospho-3-hexuloisomerase
MEPITSVISELGKTVESISLADQKKVAHKLLESNRVFIAGAGRSGLIARCFAMRLMHLGLQVFVAGDATTPAIRAGDLLVIASGSGTTASLVKMAEKAKSIGADVVTFTIYPDAAIGQMSSATVVINAPTTKSEVDRGFYSVQPMGNLFEQSLMICLDYIVLIIMDIKKITGEQMFSRHANLE